MEPRPYEGVGGRPGWARKGPADFGGGLSVCSVFSLFREAHAYLGAALVGFEADAALVVLGGVLYYGQAEARAAGGFGVALVHAVEALKHPALVLRGDAGAVVAHAQEDIVLPLGGVDLRLAALAAVFDGVVREVPDYLPEQAPYTILATGNRTDGNGT